MAVSRCMLLALLPALLLPVSGCGKSHPSRKGAAAEAPSAAVPRGEWWKAATEKSSGAERILSPRELWELLDAGKRMGYAKDAAWFRAKEEWVAGRVLSVDPDDVRANAVLGRQALQDLPGFSATWKAIQEASVPNQVILDLINRYDSQLQEGQPIFLTADEVTLVEAQLSQARAYLKRLKEDPHFKAVQMALLRAGTASFLSDVRSIHLSAGPFLLFYAARDLQRIPGENPEAEDRRIAARAEVYRKRLQAMAPYYEKLVSAIAKEFPELAGRHPIPPEAVFPQWIFADASLLTPIHDELQRTVTDAPDKVGFLQARSGLAFLPEPADGAKPDETSRFRESALYFGALQILRVLARDSKQPLTNHLDDSRALWVQDGFASYLAERCLKRPIYRSKVLARVKDNVALPPMGLTAAPESWLALDRRIDKENRWEQGTPEAKAFRDAARSEFSVGAWLLVDTLQHAPYREGFHRFVRAQVEGGPTGIGGIEKCLKIPADGWSALQSAAAERAKALSKEK